MTRRPFDRSELREMFGMVLQDTWLFSDTIMENIRYGRLDATDEEDIEAAKAARVHRFVQTLPEGLRNGAQRGRDQRLAGGRSSFLTIARTILADPKILILDEATSSVDTRTEVQIRKAMDTLMQAHQLHHRAPPLHHPRRRPDSGDARRRHRRAGHARRAALLRQLLPTMYNSQFK